MLRSLAAMFLIATLPLASVAHAQSYEAQVLELVNLARWDNGQLAPLKGESALDASSEAHSSAMALRNFFMHCDPDTGSSFAQRMSAAGYVGMSTGSENIAVGYATPAAVMSGWMGSSGHRANLLNPAFREIGIGYFNQADDQSGVRSGNGCAVTGSGGPWRNYWTQNLGARASVYPVVIDREAFRTTTCQVSLYLYGSGWAQDMRASNDGVNWSLWQPFQPNLTWTLSGASASIATVRVELRNGSSVRSAQDSIVLGAPCGGTAAPVLFANDFE